MEINDFISKDHSNPIVEEEQNLTDVLVTIDNLVEDYKKELKNNRDDFSSYLPNDYEYKMERIQLSKEYEDILDNIENIQNIRKSPYFGHMNLVSDGKEMDVYVGETPLSKEKNQIIYDWRSPISNLYYQNETHYIHNGYKYNLNYKRKLLIKNSKLIQCNETYSGTGKNKIIKDEFLRKILVDKKESAEIVDIIKSIQTKQNEIIREELKNNVIVQGVAGSGKTVIILHRLSYLLFNNPNINPESFLFITPTKTFKDKLNALNKKLGIDKISILTLSEYYNKQLNYLFYEKNKDSNIHFVKKISNDDYASDSYFVEKYSDDYFEGVFHFIKNNINRKLDNFQNILKTNKFQFEINFIEYLNETNKFVENKIKELSSQIDHNLAKKKLLLDKYHQHLIKQLHYQGLLNSLNKNIDFFETYKILSERIKQEKENRKKEMINDEKEFIKIQKKLIEIFHAIQKINNELGPNEIQEKTLEFNAKYFENIIRETNTKILNNKENKEFEIKEINKKIKRNQNFILKLFSNISTEELEQSKEKCETDLLMIHNAEHQLNKIKNANEYYVLLDKYHYYNSSAIDQVNMERLEMVLNQLNQFAETALKLQGIMETRILFDMIYKSFAMISESFQNNVEVEMFDLSELYEILEKIKSDSLEKNKIKIEIADVINNMLNPVFVWNLYKQFLEEYDVQALNHYYSKTQKQIYRADAYILIRLAKELGYLIPRNYYYLYIDEAQDYNDTEIKLIHKLEREPVINIYGDISQKIFSNVHERKDWSNLKKYFNTSYYELDENYRNTTQIVDYCNNNLGLKMVSIGISLEEVSIIEYASTDEIVQKAKELETIVITNDREQLDLLTKENIECYTVYQAKGLEFPNVIVVDDNLPRNQKYVSYTRSLKKLYIFRNK